MDTYKKLVDSANISSDFEVFISSNVGAYLLKRIEQEELEALRSLVDVPADDRDEIYKRQLRAAVPRRILQFLNNVIRDGKMATWQIEQGES